MEVPRIWIPTVTDHIFCFSDSSTKDERRYPEYYRYFEISNKSKLKGNYSSISDPLQVRRHDFNPRFDNVVSQRVLLECRTILGYENESYFQEQKVVDCLSYSNTNTVGIQNTDVSGFRMVDIVRFSNGKLAQTILCMLQYPNL